MEPINNTYQVVGDFTKKETQIKITEYFKFKIDVVLTDMAVNTTGNKDLDCIRTNSLCSEVIEFSAQVLKKKGILVAKLFMGEDFLEVKDRAKKIFKKVEFYKPNSSRSESKETYIHCVRLNSL